jgi:predicted DsbA family dithiol-disulfide isomerase
MVTVEIYSDVVCPWCYIGKRRWEQAIAQLRSTHGEDVLGQLRVEFRPYQLDPTAPPKPTPVAEAYAKKFGGAERATAIIDNVTQIAAGEGLTFNMDRALRANTRDAHRLIAFAHEQGEQAAMKERLMRAYFVEGLDVGSVDVLCNLAGEVGLNSERARAHLESTDGLADLEQELASAAEIGINAVPTFVFNGEFAVPGAQDPEVFVRVLTKLLDRAQPGSQAPVMA